MTKFFGKFQKKKSCSSGKPQKAKMCSIKILTPPLDKKPCIKKKKVKKVEVSKIASSSSCKESKPKRKVVKKTSLSCEEYRSICSCSSSVLDAHYQVYSDEPDEIYGPEEVAAPVHSKQIITRAKPVCVREIETQTTLRKRKPPKAGSIPECEEVFKKVCNPSDASVQVGEPYVEEEIHFPGEFRKTPTQMTTELSFSEYSHIPYKHPQPGLLLIREGTDKYLEVQKDDISQQFPSDYVLGATKSKWAELSALDAQEIVRAISEDLLVSEDGDPDLKIKSLSVFDVKARKTEKRKMRRRKRDKSLLLVGKNPSLQLFKQCSVAKIITKEKRRKLQLYSTQRMPDEMCLMHPIPLPRYQKGNKVYNLKELDKRSRMLTGFVDSYLLYIALMLSFGISIIVLHEKDAYAIKSTFTKVFIKQIFFPTLDPDHSITVLQVKNIHDIYDYFEYVFIPKLYSTTGAPLSKSYAVSENDVILNHYVLIGSPQLRQLRVSNKSCSVNMDFWNLFTSCYMKYTDEAKQTEPIVIEEVIPKHLTISAKFIPQTPPWRKSNVYTRGRFGVYPNGGYIAILPDTQPAALELIGILKREAWIKSETRAVFVEFSAYNPHTNLFVLIKLIFELPLSGGVSMMHRIIVCSFIQFKTKADFVSMAAFYVFVICVVLLTITVLLRPLSCTKSGKRFYYSSWTVIDIVVLVVSYAFIVSAATHYLESQAITDDVINTMKRGKQEYMQLDGVVRSYVRTCQIVFVLINLLMLKSFQLFYVIPSFRRVCGIFLNGGYYLVSAVIFMSSMILIFSVISAILFGAHSNLYGNVYFAAQRCLLILLGHFDVQDSKNVSYMESGIPFYVSYMMIVGGLCKALIFGVICFYYAENADPKALKTDPLSRTKELNILDFCFYYFFYLVSLCSPNIAYKHLHKRAARSNKKYSVIKEMLHRNKFTHEESESFLKRHNITPYSNITNEQLQTIAEEIEEVTFRKGFDTRNYIQMVRLNELRKEVFALNVCLKYVLQKVKLYSHYRLLLLKKKEIDQQLFLKAYQKERAKELKKQSERNKLKKFKQPAGLKQIIKKQ